MDKKLDEKTRLIAGLALGIIVIAMLLYFVLFRGSVLFAGIRRFLSVLTPIIYGFVLAYILSSPMQLIENLILLVLNRAKKLPEDRGMRAIRVVSSLVSASLLILLIYVLLAMLLPELISSVRNIMISFPGYIRNAQNWLSGTLIDHMANSELAANSSEVIANYANRLVAWFYEQMEPQVEQLMAQVTDSLKGVLVFIRNAFLGLIVSVYILNAKERLTARFRRLLFALFPVSRANRLIKNLRFADEKFGGFLIGKILDSMIIGVICYFGMTILNIPYSLLVSVIIGVTNIIPFFGPFIGAVPTAFLVFCVDPLKALYFLIFIILLQQFDGNFLGPRILGNSVGVSSFMVLVAILIGSGLFGVLGMIISVPICAVLTTFIQTFILEKDVEKNLPGDIEAYRLLDSIDPVTHKVVYADRKPENASLYFRLKQKSDLAKVHEPKLVESSWDRTIDQIIDEKVFDETEKDTDLHFRTRNEKAAAEKGKIEKLFFGEDPSGDGKETDSVKTPGNENNLGASDGMEGTSPVETTADTFSPEPHDIK